MPYNPAIHHRRSIRLKGYDYSSAGLYFITICSHHRLHLFGEIVGADLEPAHPEFARPGFAASANIMKLNRFGALVDFTWFDLINHVCNIELHEFIVMPNHIHGIIQIVPATSAPGKGTVFRPAPLRKRGKPQALPEIVRQFKTFSAKRINALRHTAGIPVWQRNYYEHIIRDERAYLNISEYILNNPLTWQQDMLHGKNHGKRH